MVWIDWASSVVFSEMEAAGITVVAALVVCSPVGSLARMAVFAEFSADEEGVEWVGREYGFTVED